MTQEMGQKPGQQEQVFSNTSDDLWEDAGTDEKLRSQIKLALCLDLWAFAAATGQLITEDEWRRRGFPPLPRSEEGLL